MKKALLSRVVVCAWVVMSVCAAATDAFAQGGPPPPPPVPNDPMRPAPPPPPLAATLRVFIDCDRCDGEYLRQEIGFVDYMRDRKDADVHVLVTTQGTGGGGTSWTVKFIGLGDRYEGHEHTVTFSTPSTATSDEQRKEVARILKIGLLSYAMGTPVIERLNVTYSKPSGTAGASAQKDPWNYWVFRLSMNGNLSGQESSSYKTYRFNASANRTTANWKISVYGNRNESRNSYDLGEGEIYKSRSSSWSSEALVVKSVTPRFSVGARSGASGSTFSNQDLVVSLMPAAEFNFFPYSENARRAFTVSYAAGVQHLDYTAVTVFDKTSETIPRHRMSAGFSMKQAWGSVYTSTTFTQQLNELSRTNLSVYGETNVRLFKGFSFNIYGDYSRIRDQINLAKGDASTEEVLLSLRQLQSGYSYYMGFGVSYSFGSIFNSVVNTRFNNGG